MIAFVPDFIREVMIRDHFDNSRSLIWDNHDKG